MKLAGAGRPLALAWLLALAACQPPPDLKGDAPGYAEAALAPYPGTKLKYYLVEGTEPAAIVESMRQQGLDGNEKDDRFAVGQTRWQTQWRLPVRADGRCDASRLELYFDVTVILPQLADESASPEVKRRWGNFMAMLVAHEAEHVRLVNAHKPKIMAAMAAADCGSAQAAGDAAMAELVAANDRFDAESDGAATQPIDALH